MIEIILVVAAIVAMTRIADAENRSSLGWGFLTFGICVACILVIPLPLIRIGIALAIAFAIMMAMKIAASRQ